MKASKHHQYMREAILESKRGMDSNHGGPFGAIIVRGDEIVGRGHNRVTSTNDPTAHAEVMAIRDACQNLGVFQLDDCVIYTSCEPCPMCFGAIYWARLQKVYFACNQADAAAIDFDDSFIYREIELPMGERQIPFESLLRSEGQEVFRQWDEKQDKTEY
ncbi:MAG: nucleoside deaminase [Bacteroidota bacterium]